MDIKYILNSALAFLVFFIAAAPSSYGVQPYKEVNTKENEKAICFYNSLYMGDEIIESWVTCPAGSNNSRSKRVSAFSCKPSRSASGSLKVLNQEQLQKDFAYYDGVPAFPACNLYCSHKTGAFASNRPIDGKYYSNDIYEILFKVNDPYSIKRIDSINTEFWEDSPAFSPDGKILYFVSDRIDPGSGMSDMFYSVKVNNVWSSPLPLDAINTPDYSEECPYVDPVGEYLYFSTDRDGDYDIWRIKLGSSGLPDGSAEKLDAVAFPNVNLKGSNEYAPCFSPGGNFFLFSSNRITDVDGNKTKDYDIYWIYSRGAFTVSREGNVIEIGVETRKQAFDEAKNKTVAIAEPCMTDVFFTDEVLNTKKIVKTNNDGICYVQLKAEDIPSPCLDNRVKKITLSTNCACNETKTKKGATDTLYFDVYCKEKKKHVLACYEGYKPPDTVYFPIKTIPFFVEGYWCPTTKKYSEYTPCNTVYALTAKCPDPPSVEPEVPCEENEVFDFRLDKPKYEPKTIKTRRPKSFCIQYDEFTGDELEHYSGLVDEEINKIVEEMKIVFSTPYVKEAIFKEYTIRIEVLGWTDPLKIGDCDYTGETIDFNGSFVQLDTMFKGEKKAYLKNGMIEKNTPFAISPVGGNLLLSDLRAYHTAVLLDYLWQTIPEYKELRDREAKRRQDGVEGKKLMDLVAVGNSIRNLPGIPNAAKRSVDVQLMVMNKDKKKEVIDDTPQGLSIQICYPPCNCDE